MLFRSLEGTTGIKPDGSTGQVGRTYFWSEILDCWLVFDVKDTEGNQRNDMTVSFFIDKNPSAWFYTIVLDDPNDYWASIAIYGLTLNELVPITENRLIRVYENTDEGISGIFGYHATLGPGVYYGILKTKPVSQLALYPNWDWNMDDAPDRKSTRLNSSHIPLSRMPSSA